MAERPIVAPEALKIAFEKEFPKVDLEDHYESPYLGCHLCDFIQNWLKKDEALKQIGTLLEGDEKKLDAGKARLDLIPWDAVDCVESGLFCLDDNYEATCDSNAPNLQPGRAFDNLIDFFQDGADLPEIHLTSEDILGVAKVLEFGAKKYSPRGWEKGMEYSRVFAAGVRHLFSLGAGETLDPETGLPHWHHALCNYLFLAAFDKRGMTEFDDRPLRSAL